MKEQAKKYIVRVLASVHEADDKNFENPKATMLEIPIVAFSAVEAKDKVGEVIGSIATKHTAEKRREELLKAKKQTHIDYTPNLYDEVPLGESTDRWSMADPGTVDKKLFELFGKHFKV